MSFELNEEQIKKLNSKLTIYKTRLSNPALSEHHEKIERAIRDLEDYYLDKNTEITVDDLIDLKKRYKLDLTDYQKEHVIVREFELELDKFNEQLRLEQERIDNELLMQQAQEQVRKLDSQRKKGRPPVRGPHFKKSKSKSKTKKSKTKKSKV